MTDECCDNVQMRVVLTEQEVPPFRILASGLSKSDCEEEKVEEVEEEVRSGDCKGNSSLRIAWLEW